MDLLQLLFNKYGKAQLTPAETAEVTGRSKIMLQKDRMAGVGLRYVKVGKEKSAKVYYPLTEIVNFLENNQVQTA